MNKIDSFTGEYRFLSNFYRSRLLYRGEIWFTAEHAYQASKTTDKEAIERIRKAGSPGNAKKIGRNVPMRADWNEVKVGIMKEIVRAKFNDMVLAYSLIATGDAELIEGNWWNDHFWGICGGHGQNMLGKILMEIRRELKETFRARASHDGHEGLW